MPNLNKVMLMGHLGQDPTLRHTGSGKAVCNFTLATNEKWKDKDGEKQERTEWHRIVLWDKQAEVAAQYLDKGSAVYIEGRVQTREWEDKEGAKKYTTEIVANDMQFLGGRSGAAPAPAAAAPGDSPGGDDDDLPF